MNRAEAEIVARHHIEQLRKTDFHSIADALEIVLVPKPGPIPKDIGQPVEITAETIGDMILTMHGVLPPKTDCDPKVTVEMDCSSTKFAHKINNGSVEKYRTMLNVGRVEVAEYKLPLADGRVKLLWVRESIVKLTVGLDKALNLMFHADYREGQEDVARSEVRRAFCKHWGIVLEATCGPLTKIEAADYKPKTKWTEFKVADVVEFQEHVGDYTRCDVCGIVLPGQFKETGKSNLCSLHTPKATAADKIIKACNARGVYCEATHPGAGYTAPVQSVTTTEGVNVLGSKAEQQEQRNDIVGVGPGDTYACCICGKTAKVWSSLGYLFCHEHRDSPLPAKAEQKPDASVSGAQIATEEGSWRDKPGML